MTTNGPAHVNGRTIENTPKNRFDGQFIDCVNSADITDRNFEILRKMYETQVDVKNQLIRNLEDIIDEQDRRIFNMENYIQGRTSTLSPHNKMMRGISVLSVDFGTLSEENLSLKEALRKAQKRNRELELQFLTVGYNRPVTNCLHKIPITVDFECQTEDLLTGSKNGVHPVTNGHVNGRNGDVEKAKENLVKDITRVKASMGDVRDAQSELIALTKDIQNAMNHSLLAMRCELQKHVTDFVSNLIVRYRKEVEMRKRLHNHLVELKGNIRVLCRLRPPVRPDEEADQTVQFDELDNSLLSLTNANGRQMKFTCDRAFRPCHSQADVCCPSNRGLLHKTAIFEEVGQVITSCVDGYNVCIFAYGHTGSGKTYTMEGSANDPGINRRALAKLFQSTASRGTDWQYSISVSMLEIYNEKLRDLLSSSKEQKLSIRIGEQGTLHIPGLTEVNVTGVEQVANVLTTGWRNRASAATNMNEHSSRSHAILRVTVVGHNATAGLRTTGRLNLVDLAGSERVSQSLVTGQLLKEAQSINRSLSELGNVVAALRNRQSHVPFRNSQLTRLLEDCLNGDSKTLVIVQLAPGQTNAQETLSSMTFAAKIANVELGPASSTTHSIPSSPSSTNATLNDNKKKSTNNFARFNSVRLPKKRTSERPNVTTINF